MDHELGSMLTPSRVKEVDAGIVYRPVEPSNSRQRVPQRPQQQQHDKQHQQQLQQHQQDKPVQLSSSAGGAVDGGGGGDGVWTDVCDAAAFARLRGAVKAAGSATACTGAVSAVPDSSPGRGYQPSGAAGASTTMYLEVDEQGRPAAWVCQRRGDTCAVPTPGTHRSTGACPASDGQGDSGSGGGGGGGARSATANSLDDQPVVQGRGSDSDGASTPMFLTTVMCYPTVAVLQSPPTGSDSAVPAGETSTAQPAAAAKPFASLSSSRGRVVRPVSRNGAPTTRSSSSPRSGRKAGGQLTPVRRRHDAANGARPGAEARSPPRTAPSSGTTSPRQAMYPKLQPKDLPKYAVSSLPDAIRSNVVVAAVVAGASAGAGVAECAMVVIAMAVMLSHRCWTCVFARVWLRRTFFKD